MSNGDEETGYSHILAAIDFAGDAEKVLRVACLLAKQNIAKLSLIHVVRPVEDYIDFEHYFDIKAAYNDIVNTAESKLKDVGTKVNVSEERQFLIKGYSKKEILRAANDMQVDLIVMGKHLDTELHKLLGTTADAVLHSSTCDVLTVICKGQSSDTDPV